MSEEFGDKKIDGEKKAVKRSDRETVGNSLSHPWTAS